MFNYQHSWRNQINIYFIGKKLHSPLCLFISMCYAHFKSLSSSSIKEQNMLGFNGAAIEKILCLCLE